MKNLLFRIFLLIAFLIGLASPASSANALVGACSWNGSVDANWSTPGNWDTGCSGAGGIPGTGDTLTFPLGAANATMNNDLPAISLQAMNFTGALNYTLNGSNAITLTGGMDVTGGDQAINNPLTVGGAGVAFHTANGTNLTFGGTLNLGTNDVSFTVDSASNVVGMKTLGTINGSGAAKISKYGTGELQITGSQSSKSFDIDINVGSVGTDPAAWTDLPWSRKITIASGASLNLRYGAVIGAISGAGDIHASYHFQIRQSQTTMFTGDIYGNSQMTVIGNGADTLTIDRSGGSLSYAGEINVNASSKLRLVNTTATSVPDFLVVQGSLELNNSHVGVILVGYSGGGFNYDGALILSGAAPSVASSITLKNNSTVTSVINSATDYGRIHVASPVDLGAGAPTFALQGSYTPIPGDVFNIIQNTAAGTATKTNAAFSNLAQGGVVTFNTTPLTADYLAGGNTRFALLAPPDVTPPTVQSITRASADPTSAASVNFTVIFSEPVTGVDEGDFALTTSGVSGATVSGVAGSGSAYTLTVSTGTGNGTLRLDVPVTATIMDTSGNALTAPFTSGETYTVVKIAPALLAPPNASQLHTLRPSFDWTDFAAAKGYQIQVSKSASFNTTLINVTLTGPTNSQYTHAKDLAANTLYYWRVRHKITAIQYGPWTGAFTFTTGNPPSVPSLLSPANNSLVTNTSPTLDWSDSTVPAGTTFSYYQVQVDDSADFSSPFVDANNGPSTMMVGPLSMNVKYYWRVRAWNTAGDSSAWSATRNFREALPAPTLIAPVSGITVLNLKPTFDWSNVTGATGYTIQVSLSNTFNSFAINATLKTATSQYTYTLNLQAGKTYFWRVRANGANGPSLWSTVESFVTP
ncbi:MAG: hypothetical protein HFACDABA_00338 [Anaerolineales bacterium]|nr:hypothetical protein [Anaerolineales bacterium]